MFRKPPAEPWAADSLTFDLKKDDDCHDAVRLCCRIYWLGKTCFQVAIEEKPVARKLWRGKGKVVAPMAAG
jgi:hypothetical protein